MRGHTPPSGRLHSVWTRRGVAVDVEIFWRQYSVAELYLHFSLSEERYNLELAFDGPLLRPCQASDQFPQVGGRLPQPFEQTSKPGRLILARPGLLNLVAEVGRVTPQ